MKLGILSEKYESGGRGAGTVGNTSGDPGGVSYGIWQMTSAGGDSSTVGRFVRNSAWADSFDGMKPGTDAFTSLWKAIAQQDEQVFADAQYEYIKATHFDVQCEKLLDVINFDALKHSAALQNVVWSVAVQHGGNTSLICRALRELSSEDLKSDVKIIRAIYKERSKKNAAGKLAYFTKSSIRVQESVANRFEQEEEDAINMLIQDIDEEDIPDMPPELPIETDIPNTPIITTNGDCCMDCYYFRDDTCKRYPPRYWSPVLPGQWCGEFMRKTQG